jgi:hypothetical protein
MQTCRRRCGGRRCPGQSHTCTRTCARSGSRQKQQCGAAQQAKQVPGVPRGQACTVLGCVQGLLRGQGGVCCEGRQECARSVTVRAGSGAETTHCKVTEEGGAARALGAPPFVVAAGEVGSGGAVGGWLDGNQLPPLLHKQVGAAAAAAAAVMLCCCRCCPGRSRCCLGQPIGCQWAAAVLLSP